MKKNIYFRKVIQRENVIKSFIYQAAQKISSYPKLLIEVFIRRNFGERYFSLASAITVAVIMIYLPSLFRMLARSYNDGFRLQTQSGFAAKYVTWYLFVAAFIFFFIKRKQEIKRNPSVFDFARFSLYSGDINPRFYSFNAFGSRPNSRTIEIYLEPALFFFPGLILLIVGQPIGYVLALTSIIYSLSYAGQYKKGDGFIMDKIDEIIMNEELENAFVNEEVADNTRGVRFYTHKPKSKTLRQKVADSFLEDESKNEIIYAD